MRTSGPDGFRYDQPPPAASATVEERVGAATAVEKPSFRPANNECPLCHGPLKKGSHAEVYGLRLDICEYCAEIGRRGLKLLTMLFGK